MRFLKAPLPRPLLPRQRDRGEAELHPPEEAVQRLEARAAEQEADEDKTRR
jgi:hypothetical protein